MDILKALEAKYPAAGFILVGNVYSGLRAIKDNGSGSEMPDPDNMITEAQYDTAIAEYYPVNAKNEQKEIAKKMFIDYRDDFNTATVDADTYRTNMKNYFISNVKTPIDAATTTAEVDAAVAAIDWSSVVQP